MAAIPNPHNRFKPVPGQIVKVVGACHPNHLGKICQVVAIGENYCETIFTNDGEILHTSGELGGLKPVESFSDIGVFLFEVYRINMKFWGVEVK